MEYFVEAIKIIALVVMTITAITLCLIVLKEAKMQFSKRNAKNIHVKIRKLRPAAIIPRIGIGNAAGYDLSACIDEEVTIQPGETVKIGTGLSVELPSNVFGAIFARSGLATKKGLRPANCVGVCDPDYRGEYIVAIHNDSYKEQTIMPGDRIAQLVFLPCLPVDIQEVTKLSDTERGAGGFGSTGN